MNALVSIARGFSWRWRLPKLVLNVLLLRYEPYSQEAANQSVDGVADAHFVGGRVEAGDGFSGDVGLPVVRSGTFFDDLLDTVVRFSAGEDELDVIDTAIFDGL